MLTPTELKQLSDEKLIAATDLIVGKERELLVSVLEHLREIERGRLFSALGHSSLWDYAVRRLKYSEDQAHRRISAMRLMKELPEIEEKIESGALTLTNLGLAQSLFKQEGKIHPMSKAAKSALLARLEHKSKRDAEKIVIQQSSQPATLRPDRVKSLTEDKVLVQFTADQILMRKIERLKGLLAHSNPDLTMAELMDKLCDLGLQKLDPVRKHGAKRTTKPSAPTDKSPAPERVETDTPLIPSHRREYIPAARRQEVWFRAKGQCTKCGSQHALQIEHKLPIAKGGGHGLENLTLLCRPCNQRAAVEHFGLRKMARHLDPARV